MSFDLVIFDYDGVIADSELLNNRIMAEMLTEIGLPTTPDQAIDLYMGKRWLDCLPLIEAQLGRPCPDDFQDDWSRRCIERAAIELRPVPGVIDFVADLAVPRCIASSSEPPWIETGLSQFGLTDAFNGALFSAAVHVTRGKPHPDIYLHAARAMRAHPDRILVIEDTPTGVRAGVAAGMTVVGLCAGGHVRDGHAERLLDAGAHRVVESYSEVAQTMRDKRVR